MIKYHPPSWLMYVAIILMTVVVGWFIISFISNVSLTKNKEKQDEVKELKQDATHKIDSMGRVIVIKEKQQQVRVESLAKRVEAVKVNASIEKKVLHQQYEELFKKVECFSDDSVGRMYDQKRNQPKYDSLLSK